MATTTSDKTTTYKGGYKDRPWIPRFWDGMGVTGWAKLLARNQFRVAPTRLPMAAIISLLSGFNSSLGVAQSLFYRRKIEATRIEQDPIFILGHWRSGTTLLHELMVLDPRHTFPTTYACFASIHYVLSQGFIPRMFSFLMPSRRPMDNMPAGWHRPQEDEFALCAMGIPSPYFTMAFPGGAKQDEDYLDFEGVPPVGVGQWKDAFVWFLKSVTLIDPKRIVLKSPPHTARVRVLLELFPKAKFVHISRDPFVLFASTLNLWKRLYQDQRLQRMCDEAEIKERVFRTFDRMYAAFERDRGLVPPSQFSEVRYEDLVQNPLEGVRRIYDELALGGFDDARPKMEEFLKSQSDYKKNRYEIAPETRAEIARRWHGYFTRYGYATEPS